MSVARTAVRCRGIVSIPQLNSRMSASADYFAWRLDHGSGLCRKLFSSEDRASPQSSADPAEAAHFSRLASSWWDPHGPSRLLHQMNPIRHSFIATCIESVATGPAFPRSRSRSYLDVGCGGGIFSESAARLHSTSHVLAIDSTASVLAVAKQHQRLDPLLLVTDATVGATRKKLEYRCSTLEDLPKPTQVTEQFDIVTLFEVLEHVSRPSELLTAAAMHVKPGGWLILSTISRHPISYFTTKVMAEGLLRIVPRGTHDWSKYIKPNELREWLRYRRDAEGRILWETTHIQGASYMPGLGWTSIPGVERFGNYFLGVRRSTGKPEL